tara:strand:- start:811 stop:951 length:141 start_codon:yes stop_codon:yes gene_type:complete
MEHRLSDMEIVRVPTTHFEVMVSTEVKEIINETYSRVCSKLNGIIY